MYLYLYLGQAGRRGWKGEPCSALLHGVCEYSLEESAPLLAAPQALTWVPSSPGSSSLALTWVPGPGWLPTHWTATACPLRHLGGEEGLEEGCTRLLVESTTTTTVLGGLQAFTEYRVSLAAVLGNTNISTSTERLARTG